MWFNQSNISLRGTLEAVYSTAHQVLDGREILTAESPCGSNCSYDLQMEYPAIVCRNATFIDMQHQLANLYAPEIEVSTEEFLRRPVVYMSSAQFVTIDDVGEPTKAVALWIQYNTEHPQKMECLLHNNISTVHFRYQNGHETIERGTVHHANWSNGSWLESIFPQAYADNEKIYGWFGSLYDIVGHLPPSGRMQANNLGIFAGLVSILAGIQLEITGRGAYLD